MLKKLKFLKFTSSWICHQGKKQMCKNNLKWFVLYHSRCTDEEACTPDFKMQNHFFWWRVIMSFGISVHWNGNSNWAVNWHSDIFAAFTWNKHINIFNHDLNIACVPQNMNIWTNIWLICILFPKTRNVIQNTRHTEMDMGVTW